MSRSHYFSPTKRPNYANADDSNDENRPQFNPDYDLAPLDELTSARTQRLAKFRRVRELTLALSSPKTTSDDDSFRSAKLTTDDDILEPLTDDDETIANLTTDDSLIETTMSTSGGGDENAPISRAEYNQLVQLMNNLRQETQQLQQNAAAAVPQP